MRTKESVMIRPGTTPIIDFVLPFDFDLVSELWFTVSQRSVELITKTKNDVKVDGPRVIVCFTQEETLRMQGTKNVEIQVRIRCVDGTALSSQVETIDVDRILKGGVI